MPGGRIVGRAYRDGTGLTRGRGHAVGLVLGLALAFAPAAVLPTFAQQSTTALPQSSADTAKAGQALPHSSMVQEVDGPVGQPTPQDHAGFKELQGPFTSPEQVTKACTTCHTEAAMQVRHTIHWTWSAYNPETGQVVGKNEVYNNFCVSPISNEQFCTVCHTGYGSTDPEVFQPFNERSNDQVDCLACHDQSGNYRKIPFIGGNPAMEKIAVRPGCNEVYGTDKPYVLPEDLAKIAQQVGPPSRYTCGACHFYGGGGDGVKHGDLDSSLVTPTKALDVHMDADGLNFSCQQCHVSSDHKISGKHYTIDAVPDPDAFQPGNPHNGMAATCQSCHGQNPHKRNEDTQAAIAATLNMHTETVACETCHIPEYARGGKPTKMEWNYATAGKLAPNGSPLVLEDEHGYNTYWGVKGSFKWAENVVPTYAWFNGEEDWLHVGDKPKPRADGTVVLNQIQGSPTDGKSRIWPFKIMHNNQPYDTESGVLAVFHSFGFDKDSYTMSYDWQASIKAGMKAADLPYSGHYDFVKTAMYWPIAHMVAPKEDALKCEQCHAEKGRLEAIAGVYMPGRPGDHQPWIELIGLLAFAAAFAGVLLHGLIRIALALFRRT